jgi:hypothetical protein
MDSIARMIEREVLSWAGTTAEPHRFGGIEFRVNHHEMGHLHGSRQADLPFPVRVRRELVAAGRASLHHMLPDTGWVTYYIRGNEDVPAVVELFRMNYDRLTISRVAGKATGAASSPADIAGDEGSAF